MAKDIENRLKNIIAVNSRFEITTDCIDETSNLVKDLGYYSLLVAKLIVEIEKEFEIEIDEEDFTQELISQYKNLKDYVLEKTAV